MTPEQLSKMQAGRLAAAGARKAESERLGADEHAQWEARHQRAREQLLAARAGKSGWGA